MFNFSTATSFKSSSTQQWQRSYTEKENAKGSELHSTLSSKGVTQDSLKGFLVNEKHFTVLKEITQLTCYRLQRHCEGCYATSGAGQLVTVNKKDEFCIILAKSKWKCQDICMWSSTESGSFTGTGLQRSIASTKVWLMRSWHAFLFVCLFDFSKVLEWWISAWWMMHEVLLYFYAK